MCIVSAMILSGIAIKKTLYIFDIVGYGTAGSGIILYDIIFGADTGFGAFSNGLAGWKTTEHNLLAGSGSILTRIAGNMIIALPWITALILLVTVIVHCVKKVKRRKALSVFLSIVLTLTTVLYVLTMNLRSAPNTQRLWEGHDGYLKSVDQYKKAVLMFCSYSWTI